MAENTRAGLQVVLEAVENEGSVRGVGLDDGGVHGNGLPADGMEGSPRSNDHHDLKAGAGRAASRSLTKNRKLSQIRSARSAVAIPSGISPEARMTTREGRTGPHSSPAASASCRDFLSFRFFSSLTRSWVRSA
jgi:hypothetical protein